TSACRYNDSRATEHTGALMVDLTGPPIAVFKNSRMSATASMVLYRSKHDELIPITSCAAHRMRVAASVLIVVVLIAIAGCRSPKAAAPASMVGMPGGTFWMGCDGCGMPDALPVHRVSVDGFWMDRTPVTNAEFQRFVSASGYVTVAERQPDPKDFPGVPRDK